MEYQFNDSDYNDNFHYLFLYSQFEIYYFFKFDNKFLLVDIIFSSDKEKEMKRLILLFLFVILIFGVGYTNSPNLPFVGEVNKIEVKPISTGGCDSQLKIYYIITFKEGTKITVTENIWLRNGPFLVGDKVKVEMADTIPGCDYNQIHLSKVEEM